MKRSKELLFENLNLSEESKELWKATIFMKDNNGNSLEVPVESSVNIRQEVHDTIKKLSKQGYKLDNVQYNESYLMNSNEEILAEGSGGYQRLARKALALRKKGLDHATKALVHTYRGQQSKRDFDSLRGLVHAQMSDIFDKLATPIENRTMQRAARLPQRHDAPFSTPAEMYALQRDVGTKRLKQGAEKYKPVKDPKNKFSTREGTFLSFTDTLERMDKLDFLANQRNEQILARDLLKKMKGDK